MKRGTPDHPKTKKLARLLELERWGVVGVLEALWHFTAQYAYRGDVGRFSDDEIADGIGWSGDVGTLIGALVNAGFLDRHADHRLVIHDWQDHADDAVKKRVGRSGDGFVGTCPDSVATCPDNGGRRRDVSGPPEPVPEPVPVPAPAARAAPVPPNGQQPADAAASHSKVVEELKLAGIGEPKLSELAERAGMTTEIVRRTREKWKQCATSGTGALVRNLEAAADGEVVRAERRARRENNPERRAQLYRNLVENATSEQRQVMRRLWDSHLSLARQDPLGDLLGRIPPAEAVSRLVEMAGDARPIRDLVG